MKLGGLGRAGRTRLSPAPRDRPDVSRAGPLRVGAAHTNVPGSTVVSWRSPSASPSDRQARLRRANRLSGKARWRSLSLIERALRDAALLGLSGESEPPRPEWARERSGLWAPRAAPDAASRMPPGAAWSARARRTIGRCPLDRSSVRPEPSRGGTTDRALIVRGLLRPVAVGRRCSTVAREQSANVSLDPSLSLGVAFRDGHRDLLSVSASRAGGLPGLLALAIVRRGTCERGPLANAARGWVSGLGCRRR
jgi:hypothetical protein